MAKSVVSLQSRLNRCTDRHTGKSFVWTSTTFSFSGVFFFGLESSSETMPNVKSRSATRFCDFKPCSIDSVMYCAFCLGYQLFRIRPGSTGQIEPVTTTGVNQHRN